MFSWVQPLIAEVESYFKQLQYSDYEVKYDITNSNTDEYELDLTCSSTKYFDDEDTTTYFYIETDY